MVNFNATLIAQVLNFLILVFILAKFAYKPLMKIMDDRKNKIAGDLAAAETAKTDAESIKAEYAAKLAAARQEADGASVIKERLQHVCHKKTIDSVLLFYNAERANHWGRAVLRERLGISDSAVSRILNILLERQIICRMRRGQYKFLW